MPQFSDLQGKTLTIKGSVDIRWHGTSNGYGAPENVKVRDPARVQ